MVKNKYSQVKYKCIVYKTLYSSELDGMFEKINLKNNNIKLVFKYEFQITCISNSTAISGVLPKSLFFSAIDTNIYQTFVTFIITRAVEL